MKIRFQADADLSEDIVTGIVRREPRIDFRTASEAGLRGLSDAQVLALAARDGRILVSHDRKTMPGHFAEFLRTNTSPGVLVISQKADLLAERPAGRDLKLWITCRPHCPSPRELPHLGCKRCLPAFLERGRLAVTFGQELGRAPTRVLRSP